MTWINDFIANALDGLPKDQYRQRAKAELTDHLLELCAALEYGGYSPEEAQARAVELMGEPSELKEHFHAQWKQRLKGFRFLIRALTKAGFYGMLFRICILAFFISPAMSLLEGLTHFSMSPLLCCGLYAVICHYAGTVFIRKETARAFSLLNEREQLLFNLQVCLISWLEGFILWLLISYRSLPLFCSFVLPYQCAGLVVIMVSLHPSPTAALSLKSEQKCRTSRVCSSLRKVFQWSLYGTLFNIALRFIFLILSTSVLKSFSHRESSLIFVPLFAVWFIPGLWFALHNVNREFPALSIVRRRVLFCTTALIVLFLDFMPIFTTLIWPARDGLSLAYYLFCYIPLLWAEGQIHTAYCMTIGVLCVIFPILYRPRRRR